MLGSRLHLQAAVLALTLVDPVRAEDLYQTDFEAFSVGPDQWVGSDGWLGNSPGTGSHGIASDLIPGLGKVAYLGLNQPSSTFVTVLRQVNHDPLAAGTAELEFETLMGVEDSTNGRFDDFYFSFYNISGELLGALLFSNDPLTFGIWRLDGSGLYDTTIDFTHGELHLVHIRVNPLANTWSADFDGLTLFTSAPFNATGQEITFGSVAAEWQLGASTASGFGDNWLLVADWRLTAIPPGEEPFLVDTLLIGEGGQPRIGWTGEPGWDYQVKYSDDLTNWMTDLPNSFFTGLEAPVQLEFIDSASSPDGRRFYCVERSVTP